MLLTFVIKCFSPGRSKILLQFLSRYIPSKIQEPVAPQPVLIPTNKALKVGSGQTSSGVEFSPTPTATVPSYQVIQKSLKVSALSVLGRSCIATSGFSRFFLIAILELPHPPMKIYKKKKKSFIHCEKGEFLAEVTEIR